MEWLHRRRTQAWPLAIADVAESVMELEHCLPVTAPRGAGAFPGWASAPVTLRLYRLRNVVLDATTMVLAKDGRPIAETIYEQSPGAVAGALSRKGPIERLRGPVAIACDHWDRNYYHWLAHAVPAIHVARHTHGADAALLLPELAPWQEESLDLLGAASMPRRALRRGARYRLDDVLWCDVVAGRADFAVSALCRDAYAEMAAHAVTAGGAGRMLYIDRGDAANRAIPNAGALAEQMRALGLEVVRPETLPLARQIALFRQAGLVVGQLGAGLANLAFCPPGCRVLELVPRHHANPCFLAMSLQGGLRYRGEIFDSGVSQEGHTEAWRHGIDVARVAELVDGLLAPA